MIPGIGTLINGFGVIISGILARIIFKKELENGQINKIDMMKKLKIHNNKI